MFGRTRKEIMIHRQYQEDLWPVDLDRGQIEQALLNLYVNAWQAMPSAGDLYLATENVTFDEEYAKPRGLASGRYVKISVKDAGVGMDEKTRQRVFEPFFTTKEMGRGAGLGLASTYGIISNHGGIIIASTEISKGSTFTIYLPASQGEVSEEIEIVEETLKGNETILLVDDEDMIIEVGKRILETLGYTVLVARSEKEAIELYREKKDTVDMIIVDMIMPGMGGGETFDRLKSMNTAVKVLLSSGYSVNGQATTILNQGCQGFIQKPFKIEELSRKIREILDTHGSFDASS
jgi:CheY-like chemotaxis protein